MLIKSFKEFKMPEATSAEFFPCIALHKLL